WTDLKRQFSIPNAGKAIHESTGEALTKFRETVAAFLQEHRWYCMAELPEPKRVVNVLKSVVVTLLNAPDAKQAEKDEALTVSRSRWRSTGPGATSTGHSASRTWPLWRTQARRRPTGMTAAEETWRSAGEADGRSRNGAPMASLTAPGPRWEVP